MLMWKDLQDTLRKSKGQSSVHAVIICTPRGVGPDPPSTTWVALGKVLDFSVPQFPHLGNDKCNNT